MMRWGTRACVAQVLIYSGIMLWMIDKNNGLEEFSLNPMLGPSSYILNEVKLHTFFSLPHLSPVPLCLLSPFPNPHLFLCVCASILRMHPLGVGLLSLTCACVCACVCLCARQFGASNAAEIKYNGEYWRLITPIFLQVVSRCTVLQLPLGVRFWQHGHLRLFPFAYNVFFG